jgi:hypothetical protein
MYKEVRIMPSLHDDLLRIARILEEIRDALGKKTNPPTEQGNPFNEIAKRHERNKVRLQYLRQGFQRCRDPLSAIVAGSFANYRDQGEFKAIELTPEQLRSAFAQGAKIDFDPAGLEGFPGKWKGTNRRYKFDTGEEVKDDAKTWYMVWEKGTIMDDGYVQRVVGSQTRHYPSNSLPDLSERKVDMALNVYRKDIGITGWLSAWVEFRQEMALISYQFDEGTFLWIGQVLNENLEPEISDKIFWMFLEWIDPDKKHYFMYGLMFEIDFDECQAKVFGDSFRKARFERVD